MKKRNHKFEICGQSWRWTYKSLKRRQLAGLCDYANRTVSICNSQRGLDRLDTEIHEALHALQSFASEEHTAECATTLASILWMLGYRLPEDADG